MRHDKKYKHVNVAAKQVPYASFSDGILNDNKNRILWFGPKFMSENQINIKSFIANCENNVNSAPYHLKYVIRNNSCYNLKTFLIEKNLVI